MVSRGNVLTYQHTILPFLYQTRTIRLFPLLRPQNYRKQQRSPRPFSTAKCALASLEHHRDNDAIPFESRHSHPEDEEADPHVRSSPPSPPSHSRPSTITASEQTIFDRIFADIASSKRSAAHDTLPADHPSATESFEDLNTIFDKAIHDLQKVTSRREKRASASTFRSRVVSGEGAEKELDGRGFGVDANEGAFNRSTIARDVPALNTYTEALMTRDGAGWGQPGKIGSDDVSDLAEAHKQHRMKVENMLASAETDVEVWQVLESEVFSLLHELNARIKEAEKGQKGRKRRRVAKAGTTKAKAATASTSLPPTVLLSLLRTEYPSYLLIVSRLLRTSFPTSTYALHLLPTVRRLGPISYVLGASTGLFNETLLLLWNQEKDLHGMADLLDEMGQQGIEGDEVTVKFLKAVGRVRRSELAGHKGEWRKLWWTIGSMQEGWARVTGGLERCKGEVRARVEMERDEEEEDEEEEGAGFVRKIEAG